MQNDILLNVENLKIVYELGENRQKLIVDDVDFLLRKGEILGIVGESGSGKTQTVYALLGIHVRNPGVVEGNVKLADQSNSGFIQLVADPVRNTVRTRKRGERLFYSKNTKRWRREINRFYEKKEIRGKRIFIMFQDPKSYLNPFWTIRQHFQRIVPESICKESSSESVMLDALRRFKLPENQVPHKYPHELSGGMNQRVMIALGYACRPDIIIADEITTGLDIINQVAVVKQLKELQEERQLSIILISHDIGFIAKLANSIFVMYNGQGMEFGHRDDILNMDIQQKHPYTRELLDIFYGNHEKGYIVGEPPGRDEIIDGCRFHTRCSQFLKTPEKLLCNKIPADDFGDLSTELHQIRCKLFQIDMNGHNV